MVVHKNLILTGTVRATPQQTQNTEKVSHLRYSLAKLPSYKLFLKCVTLSRIISQVNITGEGPERNIPLNLTGITEQEHFD